MNYRSDILHLRPERKLSGKRLSPHGRSGRRQAASRNQGNWVAAIAGAMTWLRVSSSGGVGGAASVSENAMVGGPGEEGEGQEVVRTRLRMSGRARKGDPR